MRVAAILLGALFLAAARFADPELVVAGRGLTLEQALAEPHAFNYRVLILRKELDRVRASHADPGTRTLIDRARDDGAVVFVCERDLRRERMKPAELLPGIVIADASDVWTHGAPGEADRRLRSYCS